MSSATAIAAKNLRAEWQPPGDIPPPSRPDEVPDLPAEQPPPRPDEVPEPKPDELPAPESRLPLRSL